MLRQTENVRIYFASHLFSSKGHVRISIGKREFNFMKLRLTRQEYAVFLSQASQNPFQFTMNGARFWLFDGKFYKDTDGLSAEDAKALLLSRYRLQQQRINRAKTITSAPEVSTKQQRGFIPDDVKLLVWQRDHGQCVRCGSQVELQYDHIIPFSLGGASTPENLQILCGTCNRAKSASVV